MLRQTARSLWKHLLFLSRVKVLYAKITFTRYTTLYFLFAFLACVILVIFQAFTYADNSQAVDIISEIVLEAGSPAVMPMISDTGVLSICPSIPQPGVNCTAIEGQIRPLASRAIPTFSELLTAVPVSLIPGATVVRRDLDFETVYNEAGDIIGVEVEGGEFMSMQCVTALMWLQDVLKDATREDVVTLAFHIWLFTLSIVTILNESLPHLAAGLFAHVLGTAWAGSRIVVTRNLTKVYQDLIVSGPCSGVDLLGGWWHERFMRTIPILVLNAVALVITIYFSYKLFQVYARQTFNRVGSSPRIHNVYKLVLVFSVSLQLTGFFMLASTAMWMDKLLNGNGRHLTKHLHLYLAAFIVVLLVQLPWLVVGWVAIRREGRKRFIAWVVMSLVILIIPALMFTSAIYRFIFETWAFFATVTVTGYILMGGTFLFGLFCRFHFGSGLVEYLHAPEVPEGADFAPVVIKKNSMEKKPLDLEDPPISTISAPMPVLHPPPPRNLAHPRPSSSIYSEGGLSTIKVSITPEFLNPLASNSLRFLVRPPRIRGSVIGVADSVSDRDSFIDGPHAPPPSPPVHQIVHRRSPEPIGNLKTKVGLPTNPKA